jgi:hypothetical protein
MNLKFSIIIKNCVAHIIPCTSCTVRLSTDVECFSSRNLKTYRASRLSARRYRTAEPKLDRQESRRQGHDIMGRDMIAY